MGTNRRWHTGYDTMIEVIRNGRLGALKTGISHMTGTLFNTSSHIFDLLFRLNEDNPVVWARRICRKAMGLLMEIYYMKIQVLTVCFNSKTV